MDSNTEIDFKEERNTFDSFRDIVTHAHRGVLTFQVRGGMLLEMEAYVAKICFNNTSRAVQAGANLFYRQVLGVVIEEKDPFARLCGALDRCPKVCSGCLGFKVSTGIGSDFLSLRRFSSDSY